MGSEPPPVASPQPTVFVVDDDADVRQALDTLLRAVGLRVETYDSADAFLAADRTQAPGCLLLDMRLVGRSGLALQSLLLEQGCELAIVFMSGHVDVPMAVKAMKNGAIDVLTKPLRPADLIDAVNLALATDEARREERRSFELLRLAHASLSAREREVMGRIVSGLPNRETAEALGISEATVKAHRARIMQKMGARTLAHLVDAARRLGPGP